MDGKERVDSLGFGRSHAFDSVQSWVAKRADVGSVMARSWDYSEKFDLDRFKVCIECEL